MQNEKILRSFMKDVMQGQIDWVEPAWGSSVGLPDCNIKFADAQFAVELKVWEKNKKGLKCTMRPAQIRYHIMNSKQGIKTAIIFGIKGQDKIYILQGKNCPLDKYLLKVEKAWLVGSIKDDFDFIKGRLYLILFKSRFWIAG